MGVAVSVGQMETCGVPVTASTALFVVPADLSAIATPRMYYCVFKVIQIYVMYTYT